jgi:phosphopantothenoylcysteine synthetase/decarboxylase
VGDEGTAKRNIIRKNNPGEVKDKKQHGGGGGKGKWNDLDDGTLDDDEE